MLFSRIYSLVLVVSLLYGSRGSGQPVKRLNHISYNITEGLLHSKVIDMAEDGNGFIWLSTGNGVQRFDGKNFYTVPVTADDKGVPDNTYVRFYRLSSGNMWLVHSRGISEYNIYSGRFSLICLLPENQTIKNSILFLETTDAFWWQNLYTNYCYRQDKKTLRFTDSIFLPLKNAVKAIPLDEAPCLPVSFTVLGEKEILVTETATKKHRVYEAGVLQKKFLDFTNYKPDTLLVATGRGIEKLALRSGRFSFVCSYKTKNPSLLTPLYIRLSRTNAGHYLLSEGAELFELDMEKEIYVTSLSDKQNKSFVQLGFITDIFPDSQHNVWILSANDGIRKIIYQQQGFRYYGLNEPGKSFVKTIYADKPGNLILCGTQDNGLLVFDSSQRLLKKISGFPGAIAPYTVCAIQKIAPQRFLLFLAGNWKAYLLNTTDFSLHPVRTDTSRVKLNNVFDYHMNVFAAANGKYIMQNSYAVYTFGWYPPHTIRFEEMQSLSAASITSCKDRQNRLWVGGQQYYYLFDPEMQPAGSFKLDEKIIVRCFLNDRAGRMWMGTERGLYQLNENGGIIRRLYKAEGLIDENIYALRDDREGNLWLSHNKGLSCMKKDGSFIHYTKEDGLQENEFNTNAGIETSDGELFFGGVNGISSFYPHHILQAYEQPRLMVNSIKIKEQELETDTAVWNVQEIRLPWSKNQLSFEFLAMGLRQPGQYAYQYRMNGWDEDWVNSGNHGMARYLLTPGNYVFEMYAGNSFAKDAVSLKKIIISIRPPFWKTKWFIGMMVSVIAILTILLTRYFTRMKLKRRIEELEKKRVLDEERLRISREMHDDIGAGLTQITMLSETAKANMQNKEQLDKIANTSRRLVNDMSEIIWSMNPGQDTLDQLLAYLREQLRQLLEYSNMKYTINFPENEHAILLNNAQKRNLLLIAKEIVHNAVKHSGAKHLSVLAEQKKSSLRFIISDDGCGFDAGKPNQGNGLRNIRRRVEESGGKLQINSSPGKGSRFTYEIPLASF